MTRRQELLAVPARKWGEVLHNVGAVYIIPSRRKHDSGFMCMDFVACEMGKDGRITNKKIRFGGYTDVVNLHGVIPGLSQMGFNIDCEPGGIIRIFTFQKPFSVSEDLSSIDFRIENYKEGFSFDDVELEQEGGD